MKTHYYYSIFYMYILTTANVILLRNISIWI